jgi:hypothetical protein
MWRSGQFSRPGYLGRLGGDHHGQTKVPIRTDASVSMASPRRPLRTNRRRAGPKVLGRRRATEEFPVRPARRHSTEESARRQPENQPQRSDVTAQTQPTLTVTALIRRTVGGRRTRSAPPIRGRPRSSAHARVVRGSCECLKRLSPRHSRLGRSGRPGPVRAEGERSARSGARQ